MDPALFLADLRRSPPAWEPSPSRSVPPTRGPGSARATLGRSSGWGRRTTPTRSAAARLRARGVDAVAELAGLRPAAPRRRPGRPSSPCRPRAARARPSTPYAGSGPPGERRGSWRSPTVRAPSWPRSATYACRPAGRCGARRRGLPFVPAHARAAARARGAADRWTRSPTAAGPGSRGPAHLLDTRGDWLPAVAAAALGPQGTHVVAPARRISSALQSALMLREGPRLPAYACETADWSHVDVYLTKTTDYRLSCSPGRAGRTSCSAGSASAARPSSRSGPRCDGAAVDRALPARRRGRRTPAHRDPGPRAARRRGLGVAGRIPR